MAGGSGNWAGRLRLGSGLVLQVFLFTHLLNASLGLFSWRAMEAGRQIFLLFWRNPPGTVLLYGALLLHVGLVLHNQFRRRSYRGMRRSEIVQALMGMAIPPLAVTHVLGTRYLNAVYGLEDNFAWLLLSVWVFKPVYSIVQTVLVTVAWTHGCIGIHHWLRLKPWYPRYVMALYSLAVLLPVLAVIGMFDGAREVAAAFASPAFQQDFFNSHRLPAGAVEAVTLLRDRLLIAMAVFLVVFALARLIVHWLERRGNHVAIAYPDGRRVRVQTGTSVLEASRLGGIAHASVCGGRGRCSTCRVRIVGSEGEQPPPSAEELKVLHRVGAPEGVRLACQLRPVADLSVVPLLPPGAQPQDGYRRPAYLQGSEREIAILFADLRSFTKFSEQKLPYDVVFVINQYFRHMGTAVEGAGGHLDKFIGDGVMALFGIQQDAAAGCRAAMQAAIAMSKALKEMNRTLKNDLPEPLRIGIGIHVGHVIVGEMGYAKAVSVTAIGDPVNTASRLEAINKEFGSQLVISRKVAERAGVTLGGGRIETVSIRGRAEPLEVYVFDDAEDMRIEG